MLLTFRLAFVLAAFAVCFSSAHGEDIKGRPQSIPELRSAIERVLKETKTPGVAVAIVSRDKVEWTAGIGKADVAADKPATDETLFRIGSVSKGFAALAALQLQEEGKLKLTDTVKQWAPDVAFTNPWEATDPVRLVHLMEHTAGFDDIHLREYALNDPTPMSLKDALAFGASSRVCRWPPGTRMAYCNSGPAVLAAVIEKVTGERFEDYVQEHFFTPLHMDTASYFYTPEVQQHITKLYRNNGVTANPYWHIALRPAGSINASAKDMANYVRFYLQRGSFDGVQLLQPESIDRMETPQTLPAAQLGLFTVYGLYNYVTCDGPFVFHGHNGGVNGGLSEMAYLPKYGRGYAFMINSGNTTTLSRISTLVRHYVTRGLTPPSLPFAVSIPPYVQQHYAGYYQNISPRKQSQQGLLRLFYVSKLNFTTNELHTTMFGIHRERWIGVADRLFRKVDQSAPTLALLPDNNGEVLIQTSQGTFKKVSGFRVWGQLFALIILCLVIASRVLLGLIRGALRLFGKRFNGGPFSVRRLPMISIILLGIFFGLFAISRGDIWTLGTRSWISIGILLTSTAFPIAAAASLYAVYRERSAPMNRLLYWHSVAVAIAVCIVANCTWAIGAGSGCAFGRSRDVKNKFPDGKCLFSPALRARDRIIG